MNIKQKLEPLLIAVSITVILAVELVVNMVTMATMSPGPVESIGFIAMAVVIVALGIPSYLMGKRGLWLCFVVLAVFLNTSFILESLRVQSEKITANNDTEIVRLDGLIDEAAKKIDEYDAEYSKAVSDKNMARIAEKTAAKEDEKASYEAARKARISLIDSGKVHVTITGNDVFIAIPRAAGITMPAAPIQLVFFLLLFGSSQRALVVFSSRGAKKEVPEPEPVKKEQKAPPKEKRLRNQDDATRFVKTTWHNIRNGRGNRAVNEKSFFRMNPGYNRETWKNYWLLCEAIGAINNGLITETDEGQVISQLKSQPM